MAPDVIDQLRRSIGGGRVPFGGEIAALATARRALLPLPVVDRRRRIDTHVFPPFARRPLPALRGKRVGVVASAGSGSSLTLIGVARALEEAAIDPVAVSACGASVLWAAMWAAGLSAQEMADFALSWQPEDYLDIQWGRVPRFALSALRGFSGLAKGEALERLLDRRLWHMSAGETEMRLHTVAYNLDRGRLEWFGSDATPELTLGELARIAVALPLFVEAVRVEGQLYVDGGVVDAFPAEPLLQGDTIEHVFGLNVFLPPGLEGEDISGWDRRRGGIVDANRQLRLAAHIEFARRCKRRLGERLTLIEPVPYRESHRLPFYDLFIDRRRWPRLIRRGYDTTVEALASLRKGALADADNGKGSARRGAKSAARDERRGR